MEVFYLITNLIDRIVIKGLFITILSIMIVGKVLKTNTLNAFAIIKGLILIYAGLNICYYFIAYFFAAPMVSFFVRATDSYSFAYYLMLVPNTVFPLLLLFKKPGSNKYVLLALSFLMNVGWMFELFVIYSTDLYREQIAAQYWFNYLWFIMLKGVFIGSVIYAIGGAIKRKMPDIHTPLS